MIFKIFYQETKSEAPRRELTKTMFIKADSVMKVREYISENKPYMIEHIDEINEALLEYEKENNPDFEVVEI